MSIELYLLPFEGFGLKQYSFSILRLCGFDAGHNSGLYNELEILCSEARERKQFVPNNFASYLCCNKDYEEPHYGTTIRDELDNRLVYVFVKDLLELEKLHNNYYGNIIAQEKNIYINRERALATMSYLKQLPKDRKVALYWM